jgi:hypothetical protein
MICSWAHLASSSATTLAHAFSTPRKATTTGNAPSSYICWNISNGFLLRPHLTCPNIMLVQATTSCECILSNTHNAPSMFLHLAYMSTPQRHMTLRYFEWSAYGSYLSSSRASTLPHAQKWQGLVVLIRIAFVLPCLPTFHMSPYHNSPGTTSPEGIFLTYMSMWLFATWTIES